MNTNNIRNAVRNYKEYNAGGGYSAHYGYLMFDTATMNIWCDEFCSLGRNSWINYPENIVNIGLKMCYNNIPITVNNVKKFIISNYGG